MQLQVFHRLADELDVHSAALQAIAAVESNGSGFLPDGRPQILFEAHWFGKLTKYRYNQSHKHLSVSSWDQARKLYRGGAAEWRRFEEAAKLDREAAIQACSWGGFQIMGFHWQALRFNSPEAFFNAQQDEAGQLHTFGLFLKANSAILRAIRARDWHTVARLYNGTGQVSVYAARMEDFFTQFLNDEWEDVDGENTEEVALPLPEVDRNLPAPNVANTWTGAGNIAKGAAGIAVAGGGIAEVAEKVGDVERVAYGATGIMRAITTATTFLLSPAGLYIAAGLIVAGLAAWGYMRYRKKVHKGEAIAVPIIKGALP